MSDHLELRRIARALVSNGKGILAIDESTKTCNARFEKLGIEQSPEQRRAYRELLLTAPGLQNWISGAILYHETMDQSTSDGRRFVDHMNDRGILVGIKVDTGTVRLAGTEELITEGLDGLAPRVAQYFSDGARFAKWRAVFSITAQSPTSTAMHANAEALARYARICQEAGLVPIVEPEILTQGSHDIERSRRITECVLHTVFEHLREHNVDFEAMILKPNMVTPGSGGPAVSVARVAEETVMALAATVHVTVAGIAFLSGGQNDVLATQHLMAMNALDARMHPWPLTFSYGRALQQAALEFWRGEPARHAGAQDLLALRSRANSRAALGSYSADDESPKALTPA